MKLLVSPVALWSKRLPIARPTPTVLGSEHDNCEIVSLLNPTMIITQGMKKTEPTPVSHLNQSLPG